MTTMFFNPIFYLIMGILFTVLALSALEAWCVSEKLCAMPEVFMVGNIVFCTFLAAALVALPTILYTTFSHTDSLPDWQHYLHFEIAEVVLSILLTLLVIFLSHKYAGKSVYAALYGSVRNWYYFNRYHYATLQNMLEKEITCDTIVLWLQSLKDTQHMQAAIDYLKKNHTHTETMFMNVHIWIITLKRKERILTYDIIQLLQETFHDYEARFRLLATLEKMPEKKNAPSLKKAKI